MKARLINPYRSLTEKREVEILRKILIEEVNTALDCPLTRQSLLEMYKDKIRERCRDVGINEGC